MSNLTAPMPLGSAKVVKMLYDSRDTTRNQSQSVTVKTKYLLYDHFHKISTSCPGIPGET